MFKNRFVRISLSLTLCFCTLLWSGSLGIEVLAAKSKSEYNQEIRDLENKAASLKNQIANLKNKKASQDKIKDKLEEQVANTQALISACNAEITKYQIKIDSYQAQIDEQNEERDEIIDVFKKRLRSIYMSNSGNSIQVLLGADSFADFLTLSELSKRTSEKDRALVESIVEIIDSISKKQEDIQVNVDAQNAVKKTLSATKSELNSQLAEVDAIIDDYEDDISDLGDDLKSYQNSVAALEKELEKYYGTAQQSTLKFDGSQFKWPVPGFYTVVSSYKWRWGRLHKGIDIAGANIHGSKIVAAADGEVLTAGWNNGGYGNYVMINHGKNGGNSYVTLYAHMSSIATKAGRTVKKGDVIGYVGSTGRSTGPHLHFEIRINGTPNNPKPYFNNIKYVG